MSSPLPPLTDSTAGARRLVTRLVNNIEKINRDPDRKIKSRPGRPASSSLQDLWDSLFYSGWGGLGSGAPADPLDPLRAVIENALHPNRPIPKWAAKYVAEANKPIDMAHLPGPKPGDPGYISPKMKADTAARIRADAERKRAEGIHDPPPVASRMPGFRLPPLPGQASPNPMAVTFRLLQTEQAKARSYQTFHHWSTTAKKYGIPTPELIAAAIATGATPEMWAIDSLAKNLQSGVGRGGDLQGYLWNSYPHAAGSAVREIYAAANASNYVPDYRAAR